MYMIIYAPLHNEVKETPNYCCSIYHSYKDQHVCNECEAADSLQLNGTLYSSINAIYGHHCRSNVCGAYNFTNTFIILPNITLHVRGYKYRQKD
jgi:hypothetical protein